MHRETKDEVLELAQRHVRAERLTHGFSGAPLLFENVAFTATAGEVVGVCGASGSGKSTLLSILAGWEAPVDGIVQRTGVSSINWVFQNPHGIARRRAIDHITFPMLAVGLDRLVAEEKAQPIIQSFRLEKVQHREFRELSGGEAQRLMLARAVALAPDLLLVDEPTAQLDPRTAGTINDTLGAIASAGSIVLVATHDPGTRASCARILDLADFAPTYTGETP